MTIKRAATLDDKAITKTQATIERRSVDPIRDRAMLTLSNKAGLRAAEIAEMHVEDLLDSHGRLRSDLFVSGRGAKAGKAREIPMHPEARAVLAEMIADHPTGKGALFQNKVGQPISANAVAQQLGRLYRRAKLVGCSSHSGRRTFLTKAARNASKAGCSIRDVQALGGHADIRTTLLYVDSSASQRSLVAML